MKKHTRLILGLLSSLLLAAGISHAAEHFDPMARDAARTNGTAPSGVLESAVDSGAMQCWLHTDHRDPL
jgi:hypothetical protein